MIEGLVLLDIASVVALLFVVLIGLPHGAFDGAIANHLGAGRSFTAAANLLRAIAPQAVLSLRSGLCFPRSLWRFS